MASGAALGGMFGNHQRAFVLRHSGRAAVFAWQYARTVGASSLGGYRPAAGSPETAAGRLVGLGSL